MKNFSKVYFVTRTIFSEKGFIHVGKFEKGRRYYNMVKSFCLAQPEINSVHRYQAPEYSKS